MTTASNWDMTDTVTLWSVTYDEFDQPTFAAPVTVACSWMAGGKLSRDDTGQEFVPGSSVWIDATSVSPAVGWRLKIGTVTGSPPSDAEVIRKIAGWNNSTFSWGRRDLGLLTG